MNNKVDTFIGRLGRRPELEYTTKKKAVCKLSIAVSGDESDDVSWKKVIVWDRQAELCKVQLDKGSRIFVHGVSQTKTFTAESGEEKSFEEVTAKLVGFTNL
jgi:single-strand DNA-binding protein